MHNRVLASICSRLCVGLFAVYCHVKASDAVAGEGYIVIDHSFGMRPYLFFSDTIGDTVLPECQGLCKLSWAGGEWVLSPSGGSDLICAVPYYLWEVQPAWGSAPANTVAHTAQSHKMKFMTLSVSNPLQGERQWYGKFDINYPRFVAWYSSDAVPTYYWWSGFWFTRMCWSATETGTGVSYGGSQPSSLDLNATVYKIPNSLGLTEDMLKELPWGWWGDASKYTVVDHILTGMQTGILDNPAFPPSNPVNPLNGKPYAAGVFDWVWDSEASTWRSHNKWTDLTTPPTVAAGPTGQWRFGKNPKGNVFNPLQDGLEWYWDGTEFDGISLPGVTPPGPGDNYNGTITPNPVSSTEELQLLSAIEQNTRSSAGALLGLTTFIPGFRSEVHSDMQTMRQTVIDNQSALMGALSGHGSSLTAIAASAASSASLQNDILSALGSGFGACEGALNGIGSTCSGLANTLSGMATKQDSIYSDMNTGFGQVKTGLDSLESKVSTAVEGLDRIEGNILAGNVLAQENIDMWAAQILHWNDSDDQSALKLQHLCDVGDSLLASSEVLAEDSPHMRVFWELEKIRWVSRDEGAAAAAGDQLEAQGATNEKLETLIDAVAAIPPPETAEINLSAVESKLDSLIAGQSALNQGVAAGPDFGWLKSDVATIKQRLGSIDNALNTRADPGTLGALELDQVQKDVRSDLMGKLTGVWSKFTVFENANKSKVDFKNMGSGRSPNPLWCNYPVRLGYLEWDMKLDWSEEQWAPMMVYRPLWKIIEVWALYMLCLFLCYKILMEV